jgi:hypothetical protein
VTASHIHSHVHNVAPSTTIAVRDGARLVGTLLCLAAVAFLVVALRLGVYEYFHGDGQVLAWLRVALHR